MTPEERRGREAEQLLTNPTFMSAFDAVRDGYRLALEQSKHDEADIREDCYHRLRVLVDVKSALEAFARTGEISIWRSRDTPDITRVQEI